MSSLLLNLRHVPDDEADEVRALLDANRFDYYETPSSRFGVSAGAIWLRDERDFERAHVLLADYQQERSRRARAEHAAARRDGTAPTWFSIARDEPLRVIAVLFGIAVALALLMLPIWLIAF